MKKTNLIAYSTNINSNLHCGSFTSVRNHFKAVYGLLFPALPAEYSRKIMQITSVTNHIWSFSQARTSVTITSHQSVAERSGILPSCAGDIICSQSLHSRCSRAQQSIITFHPGFQQQIRTGEKWTHVSM